MTDQFSLKQSGALAATGGCSTDDLYILIGFFGFLCWSACIPAVNTAMAARVARALSRQADSVFLETLSDYIHMYVQNRVLYRQETTIPLMF